VEKVIYNGRGLQVCLYMYTCTCLYVYRSLYVYIRICIYIYIYTYIYTFFWYMNVFITHTFIHTKILINMCTCICIHVNIINILILYYKQLPNRFNCMDLEQMIRFCWEARLLGPQGYDSVSLCTCYMNPHPCIHLCIFMYIHTYIMVRNHYIQIDKYE
jgi:hypothetical protein